MADLKELLTASYKPQKEAAAMLEKQGYKWDPELSTMTDKVFIDKSGNPVVLHRGSKRVSDWVGSNLPLAFGLEAYSPRFQKSKQVIEDVKQKYPGTTVTSAGHSLGGALAEKSGADKIFTYQKGSGLADVTRSVKSNQTDVRTKFDLPSALSSWQTGGTRLQLEGSLNPLETHALTSLPEGLVFV